MLCRSHRILLRVRPPNFLAYRNSRTYHYGRTPRLSSPFVAKGVVGGTIVGSCLIHYYKTEHPGLLEKDFLLSESSMKEGRWWTIITHTFYHKDIGHLFGNMLGVFYFGMSIVQAYGAFAFVVIWVGAGITGGIASLAFAKPAKDRGIFKRETVYAGASGSVLGLLTVSACTFPYMRIMVFPLVSRLFCLVACGCSCSPPQPIPFSVWFYIPGFLAWSLYAQSRNLQESIGRKQLDLASNLILTFPGHLGHAGGIVCSF